MDRLFADTIVEREAAAASETTCAHPRSWSRREQHVFAAPQRAVRSFDATTLDATALDATSRDATALDAPMLVDATRVDATRVDGEACESAWAAWIGREPEHAPLEGAFAVTKLTPLPSLFPEAPPASPRPHPFARRVLRAVSTRARAAIAAGVVLVAVALWTLWPTTAPVTIKTAALETAAGEAVALASDDVAMEPLVEAPPLADAAALVITGRAEDAARAYAALAREHPERPELATMARLLASGGALDAPEREGGAP